MAFKLKCLPIFVVFVCLSQSCRPAHGERGVRSSSASWTIVAENPIPGIDHATVEAVTLRMNSPDPLKIVFWCADASGSSMRSSAGKDSAICEGSFSLREGKIPIRCETKDGSTAEVVIDGKSLHTDQGGLFLISKNQSKVEILQMDVDLKNLPTSVDGLRNYARSDDRILKFFSGESKESDSQDAK